MPIKTIAIACLLLSTAALAADPPETRTFARGDQTVTLVTGVSVFAVHSVMKESENGSARRRGWMNATNAYWVRVRDVDGKLVCEKFALHGARWTDAEIEKRAEELFKESCS